MDIPIIELFILTVIIYFVFLLIYQLFRGSLSIFESSALQGMVDIHWPLKNY